MGTSRKLSLTMLLRSLLVAVVLFSVAKAYDGDGSDDDDGDGVDVAVSTHVFKAQV